MHLLHSGLVSSHLTRLILHVTQPDRTYGFDVRFFFSLWAPLSLPLPLSWDSGGLSLLEGEMEGAFRMATIWTFGAVIDWECEMVFRQFLGC